MNEQIISEKEVSKALDYLRDSAAEVAKAKAERIYLEEFRKSLENQRNKKPACWPVFLIGTVSSVSDFLACFRQLPAFFVVGQVLLLPLGHMVG